MIKLSNGHILRYVVASGALAFDGLGWPWERPLVSLKLIKPELFTVFIKSLTRRPREGNLRWWKPWKCVQLIPGGSVNKVGLTNPGIDWWCNEVAPHLDFEKYAIAGSIFGDEEEQVEMAIKLNQFDLVALELNTSCPNTGHAIEKAEMVVKSTRSVRLVSRHPIIAKVSVDQDYLAIAQGLKDIAEAISLNSVPWKTAFPNGEISPLAKLEKRVGGGGGGVSGKPAQEKNWDAVRELNLQGSLPVIGPSIMEHDDVYTLRRLGAKAYSFGAVHLRTPWKPTLIVEQLKTEKFEVKEKGNVC
ncbi:MAG: hypothetical protein RL536_560 [Candidatus Parcubacteria bacterium]|jgi:dihydroorotate dehydrogenase